IFIGSGCRTRMRTTVTIKGTLSRGRVMTYSATVTNEAHGPNSVLNRRIPAELVAWAPSSAHEPPMIDHRSLAARGAVYPPVGRSCDPDKRLSSAAADR